MLKSFQVEGCPNVLVTFEHGHKLSLVENVDVYGCWTCSDKKPDRVMFVGIKSSIGQLVSGDDVVLNAIPHRFMWGEFAATLGNSTLLFFTKSGSNSSIKLTIEDSLLHSECEKVIQNSSCGLDWIYNLVKTRFPWDGSIQGLDLPSSILRTSTSPEITSDVAPGAPGSPAVPVLCEPTSEENEIQCSPPASPDPSACPNKRGAYSKKLKESPIGGTTRVRARQEQLAINHQRKEQKDEESKLRRGVDDVDAKQVSFICFFTRNINALNQFIC